ncbi:sigma-70 family RNA polymerase sigma factor [Acidiferrimicrobium sp. IK]|uniref:sigma-70 family RNA polymerase sigma factor n=1 Tax=Acidiferrimicrobium sp. IK TaxID=2871700 RepID=UPI0021CAFEDA|nr:sigma-70 family RNA polymerase sigma factor [Acidiferrimicrobium sp. IK]MCU4185051.1 sigma-70 family RNA polymerase sigma factor [Acidiferrimicrobium sp. IK]
MSYDQMTLRAPARLASTSPSLGTVYQCPPSPAGRLAGPVADEPVVMDDRAGTDSSAGDFVEYFNHMLPTAVGVARRILGDQASAEDAAAEAMARAYLRWGELRAAEFREAWVVRVTTNEALGMLRKRTRRERILRSQVRPGAEAPADAQLRDGALADNVKALPRRQREVVALRYFAELSTDEVAAALDISPGSVKTHLHRAMAALRERSLGDLGEAFDG